MSIIHLITPVTGSSGVAFWINRANSIVVPGNKMDLALQLIPTPLIMRLKNNARRA